MRVDFLKNIKRSFEITFKSKWLILLSVFVISVSAISQSGNFNSNSTSQSRSSSSVNPISPISPMTGIQNPSLNQAPVNIKPETTKAAENFVSSIAEDSVLGLTLFIILLISLIVISIIIKIYASNFAIGNLYYGIKEIDEDREVKFDVVGAMSRTKVWSLFVTTIISSLIFLAILLPFVITIIVGTIQPNLSFLIFLGGFFAVIFLFIYSFTDIYLTYLVLFSNKSGFEAVSLSIKYSFKYFLENVVLRITQCLIGCLTCSVSAILTLIIGGFLALIVTVFIGTVFSGGVAGFLISAPFLIIALLLGGTLLTFVGAIVNLFYASFTYLFNKDLLKEEQ